MTLVTFFIGTFSGLFFALVVLGLTRASAVGSEESHFLSPDLQKS